jgi:small subunit ribosomal protein S7
MSRRHRADRRPINPDPKYGNDVVTKFMNSVMYAGKKSVAEQIVYGAFTQIEGKTKQDPIVVFRQALDNVMPQIEVRHDRRQALAIRWLLAAARGRNEKTMVD